ncbi:MAG: DNA mismatch endonuclease Vsr [Chloroflexi bacterium]|nr:DNA mismatch endonuclease Vsr [Chloroflexota bacterium]
MLTSPTEVRSRVMASIRSRDTTPELVLRRALHARGLRYRLHVKSLPGSPDVCFPKWRAVLLVNGCFWHRHEGCPNATTPRSNARYWREKFKRNVERDRQNINALIAQGWRVGVVWECWIGKQLFQAQALELISFVRSSSASLAEWP